MASAREEWVSKVDSVASNLGSSLARIDAGLALLALMQSQQRMANGDVIGGMGFPAIGRKGVVSEQGSGFTRARARGVGWEG